MNVRQLLGRVLLAPIFLYGGWDTLRHPEPRVKKAAEADTPQADLAVRANAALMVGAGALLLLGVLPRLASVLLAASLVPTSLAGHPFWKMEGPERKQQLTHFLKNAATIGGLLLFSVSHEPECQVYEVVEK